MVLRTLLWVLATLTSVFGAAAACGGGSSTTRPATASEAADSGSQGPSDAGVLFVDAGAADAGFNWFGKPGPWPTAPRTTYGAAAGLGTAPIIDVSTDEAQNIWAVSHDALYLMRPGETTFRKYDQADGLHLDNAMPPGITAVVGGAANEAFVGYQGADITDTQKDPLRTKGKLDRVLRNADGSLQVIHYDIHNDDAVGLDAEGKVRRLPDGGIDPEETDWSFNEDRTVMRFLYDHLYHRGTLYVGYNHGVGRIEAGKADPTTGFDYADHIHPTVYNADKVQRMGEWRALALDPSTRTNASGQPSTGLLWMGGRWTGGGLGWTPDLYSWARNDLNPFFMAASNPPIFQVAEGDSVYIWGVAALSDGSVYFASGPGGDAEYKGPFGIALWKQHGGFTYITPSSIGLPSDIIDLQRLPDDTLLVASRSGLWRWNPKAGPAPNGVNMGQVQGVTGIQRVTVDTMMSPAAVYVATNTGFELLRF